MPVASIATWVTPSPDSHRAASASTPVERLERPLDDLPAIRPVTGQPDRDRDHVLAHVNRGAPLIQHLHALPALCRGDTSTHALVAAECSSHPAVGCGR